MSNKVKFAFLLVLLLAVTARFVAAQDSTGGLTVTVASNNEVVIGLAAALSGEGLAPFGEDIKRGAELALDARPTVKVGNAEFKLKLDVQDDQCSADGGQAIANRFASDGKVVAVVGPMCSSACRAAAPILDKAGYSSISPSCTAADLTTSNFTSFNRSVVSDAFQGKVAAEFIYNTLGLKTIATIHDGSPYGEGLVAVVTAHFEELGGKVVVADSVNVGDTDFRSLLEKIAAKKPELIYFGGFAAEGARLAQQRADTGLDKTVFMGADGIKGGEFPKLAGAAGEGVYASSSLSASTDALKKLLDDYKKKYSTDPTGPFQSNAYDAVNMILDGVEKVGKVDDKGNLTIDRKALSDYIRSIKDFKGLVGVLNCDGTGECAVSDVEIVQYDKDGNLTQVAVGKPTADGLKLEKPAATPEATPKS
jgi:branched-chain amino acid transport system substrate-binding protein